jgi:hypothetical protein
VRFPGLINGAAMSEEDWTARKDLLPVAIMIDNSPDAFPHEGLDKADLIYEAFVEGGITRLMAVYWSKEADVVEPVRSARTPFVIWADELGALYGHAGEADTDNGANAAGQLSEWHIFDENAFFGASENAYYRDDQRYAPHNLATSTTALRAAAAEMGYEGPPTVASWPFKADGEGTSAAPATHGIQIQFGQSQYTWQIVQYRWDAANRTWLRFQGGGPDIDAKSGKQLSFKDVIVMEAGASVVDDVGHVLLDQFGSGPASVFLDGKEIKGTWNKADRKDRTRFYDEQGNEIALDRGPIFIEVVGPESKVLSVADAADLPPLPAYVPPPPSPSSDDEDQPTATPTGSATATPNSSATPTGSASRTPSATPKGTASASPSAPATATTATSTPTAAESPTQQATAISSPGN